MTTVFWDAEGVIMVDFLEQGCTINSVQYVTTLQKLKAHLHRIRPTKAMAMSMQDHTPVVTPLQRL